ncbi:hypothetical protein Ahia01_000997700 [Argonauta hians]
MVDRHYGNYDWTASGLGWSRMLFPLSSDDSLLLPLVVLCGWKCLFFPSDCVPSTTTTMTNITTWTTTTTTMTNITTWTTTTTTMTNITTWTTTTTTMTNITTWTTTTTTMTNITTWTTTTIAIIICLTSAFHTGMGQMCLQS